MKSPKIIYILISIFCFFAIVAGVYAQFFVEEEQRDNIIVPTISNEEDDDDEKTQEEIKTQFSALFTNQFNAGNYKNNNIQRLDNSKAIVYNAYHMEEKNENYEMKIDLPVINLPGETVAEFNNITQTVFANKVSEVMNNQNGNKTIYSVSYTAYINGNILSLVIQSTLKEGNNPQRVIVQSYNYNLVTGKKVTIADMLSQKNIVQSDAQKKINQVVKKQQEEAQVFVESGYTVYYRDLTNAMYQIANISTYFIGPNGELYIIFAYGNQNFTSEMDIILFE